MLVGGGARGAVPPNGFAFFAHNFPRGAPAVPQLRMPLSGRQRMRRGARRFHSVHADGLVRVHR
jgi:hypothetical protein